MEDLIGRKAKVEHLPFHPADMLANWADVDKAKKVLNWEPQVSLKQGIKELIAWYNAERSWTRLVDTN